MHVLPTKLGEAARRYAESSYVQLRDSAAVPAAAHRVFLPSADDRVGVTNIRQSHRTPHRQAPQIVQRRQYQTLNQGRQTTDRPRETRTLDDGNDETHP